MTRLNLLAVLLLSSSWGYFLSGTWEDDPDNFRRAWGFSPPEHVEVVHSWYWRSAHFTREEAYYFELIGDPAFAEAFVVKNEMAEVEVKTLQNADFCFGRPPWFAPKQAGNYRVWTLPREKGLVLHEVNGDRTFVYACQL